MSISSKRLKMCTLCTCESSVLDLMEDAQRVILLIFFLPYEEVVLILILMEYAQRGYLT